MRQIIFDTNILIHLVRSNPKDNIVNNLLDFIDKLPNPVVVISVVSIAEVKSFSISNGWGLEKIRKLQTLMDDFVNFDIEHMEHSLIEAYIDIDTYSKRKKLSPLGSLMPQSAIKMGKNDLWIAATAKVLNATLVTCDKDFDHLHDVYIDLKRLGQF